MTLMLVLIGINVIAFLVEGYNAASY